MAGACGGKKGGGGGGSGEDAADVEPVRGGSATYGVEAETGDGWCLQEGQLAISGILVARSIYDTLTAPNEDGEYVPYLAEAVEPSEDYTQWTITVREGVTFHDGTPLTAEVVKNNLDAYRGAEGQHARSPLLFLFVLDNIESVEVTGERDVTVTTKVPWVGFDGFLYSSGRLGITAQAQLDDTESCNTDLIGTGPFMLEDPSDWVEGREFRAVKNPDYWQEAPDGEPYPYLDELVFQPIIESEQRVNALLSGDIDLAHFSGAQDILDLREEAEAGTVRAYETNANGEVGFLQLNNSKPPFDDVRVRRAMALAIDRDDYREVINKGADFENASGPFAPGSPGYVEDSGFPMAQDLEEAKRLIAEYEAEVGPIPSLTYQATPGAATQELALYLQQTFAEIGLEIDLQTVQQDALIDNAISGSYDMMGFRNYPGGDPDELYVWFKGQSPVNFSRFDDPEVNELLDRGRSETDPEARAEIYQDLNRRMGEQAFSLWSTYTTWMIASQPGVYGYDEATMPDLPDGSRPSLGLAAGHPMYGLWITE
ncbi:ABC transporter substrate-binding protein [Iamia sp. SCSIO 61187]|uniref:ABC transporter substrate-binding protein n=1 Tax=Iamia sp. SCSIO 61187 TaxID=2722752 RepID=UPI001C632DBB|nr:ABC transporter substrate-binding protein [Iamia sp. SCSIO 61187]QYG92988.1 ABC transporter substrate-binding protein [Iamia sp. SCSIO 61187]